LIEVLLQVQALAPPPRMDCPIPLLTFIVNKLRNFILNIVLIVDLMDCLSLFAFVGVDCPILDLVRLGPHLIDWSLLGVSTHVFLLIISLPKALDLSCNWLRTKRVVISLIHCISDS